MRRRNTRSSIGSMPRDATACRAQTRIARSPATRPGPGQYRAADRRRLSYNRKRTGGTGASLAGRKRAQPMTGRRRTEMKAFTLAIAATLALPAGALSQATYPDKPVRIICDSAPGSATDVSVRLMAERLSTIWGQQAVVDNRPGGGGSIAARAGQTATPDGYTLYVGAASTFIALKGAPGVAPRASPANWATPRPGAVASRT